MERKGASPQRLPKHSARFTVPPTFPKAAPYPKHSQRFSCAYLSLDVKTRLRLQRFMRITRNMNAQLEPTMTNERETPKLASGTRGREFESHRPDHSQRPVNIEENALRPESAGPVENLSRTVSAQNQPGSVRFPRKIRFRPIPQGGRHNLV